MIQRHMLSISSTKAPWPGFPWCLQEGLHQSRASVMLCFLGRPSLPQPLLSLPFDLHEGALDHVQTMHMPVCMLEFSCTPKTLPSCPRNSVKMSPGPEGVRP